MGLGIRAALAAIVFHLTFSNAFATMVGPTVTLTKMCGLILGTPGSEIYALESNQDRLKQISNYEFATRIEVHRQRVQILKRIRGVLGSRTSEYKKQLVTLLPYHPGHYDSVVDHAIWVSENEIAELGQRLEREQFWETWDGTTRP